MGGIDQSDPFATFLAPPPNETSEERDLRERKEAEARRVSDRIDDELKTEKAALKKQQKGLVKVLLLGQSESGKSTTLKSAFRSHFVDDSILTLIPFLS
jgi:tRNA U34 5-carboxymethylaminomethyl modifying GTPase MnmE/TrmE